jgi:polar amino acid transport system permease protein
MHWSILWEYRAALLDGLLMTLELSVVSIIGSFALGTAVGCLLAEIFILYFLIGLDAVPAGLLALILHQSASIAEVIGSGFRAIPPEQAEAAITSGLSPWQVARHVILPQVFAVVMPPLTSQFIEVVKNSSVVMMIGLPEMTYVAQDIASETFRGFEASTAVTAAYVAIALLVSGGMGLLGRRMTLRTARS